MRCPRCRGFVGSATFGAGVRAVTRRDERDVDLDDDDEEGAGESGMRGGKPKKIVYREFDCPECDANNPYDDGFSAGAIVRCMTCGTDYDVFEATERKPRLREK